MLSIIDRRLRDALRARRVSELDGLVFAAAGSTDIRSNALVARRARQWSTHHRLPCVTAFATGSGPTTAEAVRTLRAQGRRHIAVGSWFLAPGLLYTHQAELAAEAGAVAVSAPMGGEPEIAEVALTRYVVSAMELVDVDEPIADPYDEPAPLRHLSVVSALIRPPLRQGGRSCRDYAAESSSLIPRAAAMPPRHLDQDAATRAFSCSTSKSATGHFGLSARRCSTSS